jgi:hypothetical protein
LPLGLIVSQQMPVTVIGPRFLLRYGIIGPVFPIGSGVTEVACKTLIKQRFCLAGMRWKQPGAAGILNLRALVLTAQRWTQFWQKINLFGVPSVVAALN